ncbi:MAG: response regulator [Cyclobacteriaceae bacterium]
MIKIFGTLILIVALQTSHASAYSPDSASYLRTPSESTILEVLDSAFYPKEHYPDILKRPSELATWIQFDYPVDKRSELVFDFVRKDFVDVFVLVDDSLIHHFKTGFLLPAKEKKMGRWNTVNMILQPELNYTIVCKIVNTVNDPDLKILIQNRKDWREDLLYGIIAEIAFLSVMLILSLYALLIYFQSKMRAYLHFSMYMFAIFVFYLFIQDTLRDFFIQENPHLTLYCIVAPLLTPFFYLGFLHEFLDAEKVIPKWNKFYRISAIFNIGLFFLALIYFALSGDYYTVVDVVRYSLLINVLFAIYLIILIWKKRTSLVYYFIVGSALMLTAALTDLIIWTQSDDLGQIARFGFIAEVFCFSLGLGKKHEIIENEKEEANSAYIDQLEINEKLNEDHRSILEKRVKERTKELQIAKEEADQNAHAKEEFLSIMSHEIRTPMNAIVGLTHMLSSENEDQEFVENLTTLRYSVDNLMLLINNTLDYNKISAGKVQLERVEFNLKKIVERVAHLFKSKSDSKGLDFELIIDKDIPDVVIGDPFRLSQILNNFLSNAIKFTETGSIKVNMRTLYNDKKLVSVIFKISDTGMGISKENQKGIFESFAQASVNTARKFGGTGLGLSISKALIDLMNGKVSLESTLGKGSVFSFSLVFEKSNKKSESNTGSNFELSSIDVDHLTVLIVDDNELNRLVLKKFMNKWGVDSEESENGVDALEKMRSRQFDIILLDLQMPEMSGYEVAEIVRNDSSLKSIPIIAISADNISNVYEKVIASGIDDFITKPFDPSDLKTKMLSHTSKER